MQVGTPTQAQPIGLGATNATGWVYGLFELALVLLPIVVAGVMVWWMVRNRQVKK
jgi:hypothetical protein